LSYQCIKSNFTDMRREGIEPSASPLSAERSAAELPARTFHCIAKRFHFAKKLQKGRKRAKTPEFASRSKKTSFKKKGLFSAGKNSRPKDGRELCA
jgi:hypothetical protein